MNCQILKLIMPALIILLSCCNKEPNDPLPESINYSNPQVKKEQIVKIKKLYKDISQKIRTRKLKVKTYKTKNLTGHHPEDPYIGYNWAKCYFDGTTNRLLKIVITYPDCQISSFSEYLFYPDESLAFYYYTSGPTGPEHHVPPAIEMNSQRYYFFQKSKRQQGNDYRFIKAINYLNDYNDQGEKKETITDPLRKPIQYGGLPAPKTVGQIAGDLIFNSEKMLIKFKEGKSIF